jgi:hypothetical protein
MKISRLDAKRIEVTLPDAPVYYPSLEEFKDPLAYIRRYQFVLR